MKKSATAGTMTVVNTVWALAVGSLMLRWIVTDLYPHMIADGSLEGDVPPLVGAFALAVLVAAPSLFKARAADALEVWKEYRSRRDG